MTKDYTGDLRQAKAKLLGMLKARESLETEIAKQKRIVAALAELANLAPPSNLATGLTDAVRTIMRSAEKPLTAAEVYSRVRAFNISPQQNLSASVSTTIRRLVDSSEIEPTGDAVINESYRWKGKLSEWMDATQVMPRQDRGKGTK